MEQSKERLRVRAAQSRGSMEEEARNILRAVVAEEPALQCDLAQAIRRRFNSLGGVELQLPERGPIRQPPKPAK